MLDVRCTRLAGALSLALAPEANVSVDVDVFFGWWHLRKKKGQ